MAARALFVQPFTLAAAELEHIFPNFANEAHAGGFEASLIMEIAPDTIKGTVPDTVPESPVEAFDYLTMAQMSPSGVWGEPSQADRERGRRALAVMVEHSVRHISEAIARIEAAGAAT